MSKKMLIEATHPEETRVVVIDGSRLEEMDVETSTKKQLKGNIYLAKVVRVEPSLQAAFVDYGGNRHGFLSFNEIHPDYYQIPVADKEALKKELQEVQKKEEDATDEEGSNEESNDVEVVSEEGEERPQRPRYNLLHRYKIQEVIHHNQIILIQVIKEERGNKGAALTTYLSLAGRYSVLMPNNSDGGGVSRKISNAADRKRLKAIVEGLPLPDGMSVIVRTAGKDQKKPEIKRDYDYLIKTWTQIRNKTLASNAPALIHEEANLIKRSLRDVFSEGIEEVLIEGGDVFKTIKDFVKLLMPAQVKKVKLYENEIPLFQHYNIETQMEEMHNPTVNLKSGGYLVVNQTEALVAIDVNSGRATRERNIEETALNTNLEAADEIARQMRLRDLAGLVVIDFIDMDEMRNNHAVERRMRDALKKDRARVQMGRISGFGLMELSRQRLRPSLMEGSHHTCPYCHGRGVVRSVESCAMHALHLIEETGTQYPSHTLTITLPREVAFYVLNNKRKYLSEVEQKYDLTVKVEMDDTLLSPTDFRIERQRIGGEKNVQQNNKSKRDRKHDKRDRQEVKAETQTSEQATEKQPQAEEENRPNNNKRDRNRRRNKHRERRPAPDATATNADEGFTVVHAEPLVLFDSHPVKEEVKAKTEEKPAAKKARAPKKEVKEETPAPAKEIKEKKAKKPSKKEEAPAPAEEKKSGPKKGGWWNKLTG